jgi:hypothetical protein
MAITRLAFANRVLCWLEQLIRPEVNMAKWLVSG